MGTAKSAKDKMNWFANVFQQMTNQGISISEKKLISQFCIVHGSTERKAKEIIKIFENSGEIKRLNAEIVSTEHFEEITGNKATHQLSLHEGGLNEHTSTD